jgi:hypothetical protein
MLDASGAVKVAVAADTVPQARAALDRGEVFAVVGIPPETERDVLKGTIVHIPIYADATYLFIFRTLGNGVAVAINTLSSELAAGGARTDGSLVKATLASTSPAAILLQPIFNPVGGYGSYIVPAAFVLILLPEVIQHSVDVVWTNLPLDAVLDHRCPADDLQYRLNDAFFSYERPRILGGLQPLLHHFRPCFRGRLTTLSGSSATMPAMCVAQRSSASLR